MLWLLTFLGIVIFLFCYFLFAPFYINIDSKAGLYRLRFHTLISLRFFTDENPLLIELKIAGWKKRIDISKNEKKKEIERADTGEIEKEVGMSPDAIQAIFSSFKVNTFYINFCAENMALNGILYPGFLLLKRETGMNIGINFWNENEIELEMENTFYRIIRAYLNHKQLKKIKENGQFK